MRVPAESLQRLSGFVDRHAELFVLTGAGVSTASGIPDYRDADGNWKTRRPVQYGDFMRSPRVRCRYWARAMLGWRGFAAARPNPAHHALAGLERSGRVSCLVTQNVDRLHQRAGSRRVIDLHGRLDRVECVDCGDRFARDVVQSEMERANPAFTRLNAAAAPDGDTRLEGVDFDAFHVPRCESCGGTLKPGVVFFGENVPRPRVEEAFARLAESSAMLVVGSSLMVWSGYRFCKAAVEQGKPVAAINLGRTRADAELALKVESDCADALTRLSERRTDVSVRARYRPSTT